jgi:hypothetical protein
MSLYLEWEANLRHAEMQRLARERRHLVGTAHDSPSLFTAIKKLFGASGSPTIATAEVEVHVPKKASEAPKRKAS